MFSPYYAWARRRQGAGGPSAGSGPDPDNHCALNVALYGAGRGRWAMTERGAGQVLRAPGSLEIGPSAMTWDGSGLTIHIDEVTVPLPGRLRGTVRVVPETLAGVAYPLDAQRRHYWQPIAPRAAVEVALDTPAVRWRGTGYFDSNHGVEPLASAFKRWDWSRASLSSRRCAVLYDVERRDGSALELALHFDGAGAATPFSAPPRVRLPPTGWRIERATRSDPGVSVRVVRTAEDAPFYARSLLDSKLLGEPVSAVHESLSLDRFNARWVQLMLPFRMPRSNR